MEHEQYPALVYPVLPLSSAAAAASCFKVPDTPPLTPLEATPKTPRKPANPLHSVAVSRGEVAIISFKMMQSSAQMSPSLKITSLAPATCKRRAPAARRRLWVQPGDTCESFSPDTQSARSSSKDKQSPLGYIMDGGDADDEMEENSPISYFSPPYSPEFIETISEAAAKPSSSSYPYPTEAKRSSHFVSPKARATPKSKTCASCKTKKTPLWRDSEDGTPYCNACGIRFKKYRFRCSSCLYIPRKDEREVSKACCQCGARLVHCKGNGRY